MLNTVFFGTPAVAVPFLEKLASLSRVRGVVTAPDKPAGRGYVSQPPPVKTAALARGLPLAQPASLRHPPFSEELAKWGPADLGVVVAYGKLIPRDVFSLPRFGLVNVHFSLLPRYRGAAPVQWALIRGERETGVTLFRIDEGLDTGPVLLQRAVAVRPEDNAAALMGRLGEEGTELLEELLVRLEAGPFEPAPQQGEPSLAPILAKEDGRIRWDRQTAQEAANLVRGTYEWPGAYGRLRGQLIKIRAAEALPRDGGAPGEILGMEPGRGLLVQCRSGVLAALRVQPEGKKEMDAASFWNGARLKAGDRFDLA